MFSHLIARATELARLRTILFDLNRPDSASGFSDTRGCRVISYRNLLAERLEKQQRIELYCPIDDELRYLRTSLGQITEVAVLTETEFLLSKLEVGLAVSRNELAITRFFDGLFNLSHLPNPIIFCCLSTVGFDRTQWIRSGRYHNSSEVAPNA